MNHDRKSKQVNSIHIVTLSIALVGIMFLLQGDVGLSLSDEGHLWYGVTQTAQGAIPIKDFRSYDPGRYYWAAGWFQTFGSGIITLRIANALFQIIGLALGLLTISRVITNKWLLILVGGLLVIWMFPRHKLYEHSVALAAVFFAVLLIEKPSIKRHFIAGVFVGIAAFFARNYGGYCFFTFLSLIIVVWFKVEKQFLPKKLAVWTLGIVVGYLPMLIMLVFIPDFLTSFIDSLVLMFGPGAPVLPTPIPWPWTRQLSSLVSLRGLRAFGFSLIILIVPVFYLLAMIHVFLLKQGSLTSGRRLLIGSVFVGAPLMHHAAVRSDLAHLAQIIHPFLIALIALPFALKLNRNKWFVSSLTAFLLMVTFAAAVPIEIIPIARKLQALASTGSSLVRYELVGDTVWISKTQADYIDLIRQFVNQNVRPDENILIAPYEPGLYPILGRTLPIWDPYPLFPVERERQEQIIQSLNHKNVNWALISNRPQDGINMRRFSNTHNLVWQYLMEEFDIVDLPGLPSDRLLLHRRR